MAVTLAEWAEWMFAGGEQWTDWLPLSETEFARVPEGEGAYVVGIKDRAKIGRLLEDDPHSVIDIGESMQLRERLRDFVRCAGHPFHGDVTVVGSEDNSRPSRISGESAVDRVRKI